jgi:hypothetical protein
MTSRSFNPASEGEGARWTPGEGVPELPGFILKALRLLLVQDVARAFPMVGAVPVWRAFLMVGATVERPRLLPQRRPLPDP